MKTPTFKKSSEIIRAHGLPVDCYKGQGYIYFVADDYREIPSIYVNSMKQFFEGYATPTLATMALVQHVSDAYREAE